MFTYTSTYIHIMFIMYLICYTRYEILTTTPHQDTQPAVIASYSAKEKDEAFVERKHFPMNLNRTGYVSFSVS